MLLVWCRAAASARRSRGEQQKRRRHMSPALGHRVLCAVNTGVTSANRGSVKDEVPPILGASWSPADPEALQAGS